MWPVHDTRGRPEHAGMGQEGSSQYIYVRGVRPLCLVQCDHVAMFISCSVAEMGLRDVEYEGMEPRE